MRVDFSLFSKIGEGIALAKELTAWYNFAKQELPILRTPCINALITFKKVCVAAEIAANKTGTPIDDGVVEFFDSIADQLLKVFHATDDYNRMMELDKLTQPK